MIPVRLPDEKDKTWRGDRSTLGSRARSDANQDRSARTGIRQRRSYDREGLAERLGWRALGRSVTAEIARVAKVDREQRRVATNGGSASVSPFQSLCAGKLRADASDQRRIARSSTPTNGGGATPGGGRRGFARKFRDCGRRRSVVRRNRPDAFHVFIYPPEEEKSAGS